LAAYLWLIAETSRKLYALGLIISAIVFAVCAVRVIRVDPRIVNFVKRHRVSQKQGMDNKKRKGVVGRSSGLLRAIVLRYYVFGLILPIVILVMIWALRWIRINPKVRDIMKSPTVTEKYRQANGIDPNDRRRQISPLVRQAEIFGEYLDPVPIQKGAATPARPGRYIAPRPKFPQYTPKFELHGTCYYASRPDKSMALVSQPGAGERFHWVRKGDRLGHFILEEIKRGSIVYTNGTEKHKMKVQNGPAGTSMVRDHRIDPGTTSNAETPEPVVIEKKHLLVQGGEENRTSSKEVPDK